MNLTTHSNVRAECGPFMRSLKTRIVSDTKTTSEY